MLKNNIFDNPELKSTRDAYGEALLVLGKDKNIAVVSADLAESTRVHYFAKKYPERFVEVGVAEQSLMGVAAGLALGGKTVFASSFAVFSPGRNWDQLRVSVCYSKANVKIVSTHTGLSVGEDGASHQALEDIAITRVLPNLTVLVPADYEQTKQAIFTIAKTKQPTYVRLTRQKSPLLYQKNLPFKIGKANVLKTGTDLTIVACGPIIYEALVVAREAAKKKISVEVIDCPSIKPLDKKTIIASVKKTKKLITLEEHQIHGGLGSAIVEMLSQNYPVPTKIMGIQDTFGESGDPAKLLAKYQIDRSEILKNILLMTKK